MKKLFILIIISMFSFLLFAVEDEKLDSDEVVKYLEENGIEYEMMMDKAVTTLPKDAKVLSVEDVESFLESEPVISIQGTQSRSSITLKGYAYSRYTQPHYRRIALKGKAYMPSGSDGYQYKWERKHGIHVNNITRDRHCPGGSSSSYVTSCEEPNENIVTHYGDTDEVIACTCCEDGDPFGVRFSVRSYAITWIWNGWFWAPIKMYGSWFSTWSSGDKHNYVPTDDMCGQFLATDCDLLMAW